MTAEGVEPSDVERLSRLQHALQFFVKLAEAGQGASAHQRGVAILIGGADVDAASSSILTTLT